MEAIPSIVCDTLYSMGLHDQTPSWKIMDSKGRITVVLAWEKLDGQITGTHSKKKQRIKKEGERSRRARSFLQ